MQSLDGKHRFRIKSKSYVCALCGTPPVYSGISSSPSNLPLWASSSKSGPINLSPDIVQPLFMCTNQTAAAQFPSSASIAGPGNHDRPRRLHNFSDMTSD
ncbi:hypothetical protein GWI33_000153 [Rhynchophorus ferrugineus]|uniref:Uncharacterized protein n=1 Tax=Rhynchophorus ferrugineus TaxID=354439 RepID=A0A834J0Q3_RHYFE|nr:hypothetical protein GWI33_000153 [Rhynchophorus ferrugineus]